MSRCRTTTLIARTAARHRLQRHARAGRVRRRRLDHDRGRRPATTTTPATTDAGATDAADSIDAAALRDEFNKQLLQVLTTTQNLTELAGAVRDRQLEETVTDEQLQDAIVQAAQSGQPPQDLIDAGFQAGKECANQ